MSTCAASTGASAAERRASALLLARRPVSTRDSCCAGRRGQCVAELQRRSEARGRVERDRLLGQRTQRLRPARVRRKSNRRRQRTRQALGEAIRIKAFARQRLPQHHAHAEHVGARVESAARQALRRGCSRVFDLRAVQERHEPRGAVLVDVNVLRRDLAVNEGVLVGHDFVQRREGRSARRAASARLAPSRSA